MPDVGKDALRARVLCPFYRDHSIRQPLIYVKCEGSAWRSRIRLCFTTREGLQKHMDRVCCQSWKSCPYAAAANDKYEDVKRRINVRRWHKKIVYRRRPEKPQAAEDRGS